VPPAGRPGGSGTLPAGYRTSSCPLRRGYRHRCLPRWQCRKQENTRPHHHRPRTPPSYSPQPAAELFTGRTATACAPNHLSCP